MHILDLFRHNYLKARRKKGFYKNIGGSILIGFLILYFGGALLLIGFFMGNALTEVQSAYNPVELFSSVILYMALLGILVRHFIQPLNTVNIHTYQMLPIKRNSILNYIILKPFINPINYISLIAIIPFSVRIVAGYYNTTVALGMIVLFIFISMLNIQLGSFLKRSFAGKIWKSLILIAVIAGVVALEWLDIFSLFAISRTACMYVIQNPVTWLGLLLLVALSTTLQYYYFNRNRYPEDYLKAERKESYSKKEFTSLNRFGKIGEIISLELKMFLRHKRTKSTFYTALIFLLFGFIFYPEYQPIYQKFLGAVFITGMMIFTYGQWVFSWDSNYFDCILTKNILIKDYIKGCCYLMVASGVIAYAIAAFYAFIFGAEIIYYQTVALLYNIGIATPFLIFYGTYNSKRIELSTGSAMSYQGVTFKNFLIIMPIMFFPLIVIAILTIFLPINVALGIIAGMGLLGVLLSKQLLHLCVKQFYKKKYQMADGFREKE